LNVFRTIASKYIVIFIGLLAIGLFSDGREARGADGTVLKKFSTDSGLPNAWVKGVFRDGDRVLVSYPGGTATWDPVEGKFVPFRPGKGFKGSFVTGLAMYGGKTYVGTEAALNVREGGNWTSLDRFQQVQHSEELLYSDNKSLYAIARVMFGGVLRYDGANWSIVSRGSGTGIMNNATSLHTRGGEIFIGTTTNGLFYFDGNEWKVISPEQGLPGIWVTSLAETSEGVWIGCYNGLALFQDGKLRKFTAGDGLPSNKISVLKVIKDKLVIGTMDGGAAIKIRNLFVKVNMENGLSDNRIEAVEAADEGAWVGTVNGLNLVEVR
jgi:hypothetical protein